MTMPTTALFIGALLLLGSRIPSIDSLAVSRRRVFARSAFILTGGVRIVSSDADPAWGARGAAELDLEYYLRDIVGGNKREGSVSPSAPIALPPPRTLEEPLLSLLLDDDCSSACLSTQVLVTRIKESSNRMDDERAIEEDIQRRVASYRAKTGRSFSARAPWRESHVSDQYYFDFTAYALWRTAAEFLPDYRERDAFARDLGREIYAKGREKEIFRLSPAPKGSVVGTIDCVAEILDAFTSSGFCKSYRIGEASSQQRGQQQQQQQQQQPVFDVFDDEALASGGTVDLLVSVVEPSTLGASLQITGEQSRFSPDFVGTTLAAMFEGAGIPKSSWEMFFVDPVYRPNPKDYFPNEQLLQYTLSLV